ncbi:MAG: rhomboid family intramembrane serine protease [Muribaculaceae bacterium]|nr:rhomboid family intramembrane serine protease [Muribaculaceae bacterium]
MSGNSFSGFFSDIPPVTRNLIIINVLIWLVEAVMPSFGATIINTLGLHYVTASNFNPAQIITYMFIHDNHTVFHVLFNMFTLWMFGRILEHVWGSKRYFIFYMVCGIGAAVVQEAVWSLSYQQEYIDGIAQLNGVTSGYMREIVDNAKAMGDTRFVEGMAAFKSQLVTVGASGAIFGLLLGFAMVFPNMPLYFFFIPVPVKAKWMVLGYGVVEFFLGISNSGGTVAHFAHLGGMLFGFILLMYWRKNGTLRGNNFYN